MSRQRGFAVERISANGGGYTIALRNLYDFGHAVALQACKARALDAYSDGGERLAIQDGRDRGAAPRALALPVTPDPKQGRALATAGNLTDIANRAGKIQDALNAAASCTIHLVPRAGPRRRPGLRREAVPIDAQCISLWQAAAALSPAEPRHRELQETAASLVQEGGDLRINFPKETVPSTGVRRLPVRDVHRQGGPAAAKPKEKFEVAFYNFYASPVAERFPSRCPPVAGGWRPVGKTEFAGLPPGRRFVAQFELSGAKPVPIKVN